MNSLSTFLKLHLLKKFQFYFICNLRNSRLKIKVLVLEIKTDVNLSLINGMQEAFFKILIYYSCINVRVH